MMTNVKCVAKIMVMMTNSITPNLEIESMLIYPRTWGIETIKQKQNEKHEYNFRTSRRQQGCNIGKSN